MNKQAVLTRQQNHMNGAGSKEFLTTSASRVGTVDAGR